MNHDSLEKEKKRRSCNKQTNPWKMVPYHRRELPAEEEEKKKKN